MGAPGTAHFTAHLDIPGKLLAELVESAWFASRQAIATRPGKHVAVAVAN
jgi:hypothetical protein